MNLLGKWNKDKTVCWQITSSWPAFHGPDKWRVEKWQSGAEGQSKNNFTMTFTGPWRGSLEEAHKDIPDDQLKDNP